MPQLNRDILREVFYEIANTDGFDSSMDKFMMAGKEPFKLVLDICKKAKDVIIFHYDIFARLPNVHLKMATVFHDSDMDADDHVPGTIIPTKMKLFKPISIALVSSITSLDIRGCSPKLIPMLKSIDREMEEVIIRDYCGELKLILEACVNISNVRNGVTIDLCNQFDEMKFFAIPCRKLTLKRLWLDSICKEMNFENPHLHNIYDLTIEGRIYKTVTFHKELKEFAAFLSINFSNLETLDVMFEHKNPYPYRFWDGNSIEEMANQFKDLPPRMKGCICFKIINPQIVHVNLSQYPGVQKGYNEYYKIFPITDTLTFKMSYAHEH